jgi:hypothetical protein
MIYYKKIETFDLISEEKLNELYREEGWELISFAMFSPGYPKLAYYFKREDNCRDDNRMTIIRRVAPPGE